MIKIFADFETTGINPMQDEIITGYFVNNTTGEIFDFKSQVNKWSDEAEKIHKISESEMHTYPTKDYAYQELLKWLPGEFELVCYANQNTMHGFVTFDYAILKMEIMDHLGIYHEHQLPNRFSSYSVHALAKQCAKEGFFTPFRNEKTKRESFKQELVYSTLFGKTYNAHSAQVDTEVMIEIYTELNNRRNRHASLADKNQLSLL